MFQKSLAIQSTVWRVLACEMLDSSMQHLGSMPRNSLKNILFEKTATLSYSVMEYQEVDSVTFIFAKKQLDGPVHDLRLRCAFTQLLRRLLCHVAEANQQGIQGFGDLAVWEVRA